MIASVASHLLVLLPAEAAGLASGAAAPVERLAAVGWRLASGALAGGYVPVGRLRPGGLGRSLYLRSRRSCLRSIASSCAAVLLGEFWVP